STTPPARTRMASNRMNRGGTPPASASAPLASAPIATGAPVAAASPEESNVQLASGTQDWTAPASSAAGTSPAAPASLVPATDAVPLPPAGTTSQIRIVPPAGSGGASTDIVNLPPKGSAWPTAGDKMQ